MNSAERAARERAAVESARFAAHLVALKATPDVVAALTEWVNAAMILTFIEGVHHDVNERRAVYVAARATALPKATALPRAQVRAGAGFLGDPSSALVLRGRLLPGEPKPGHSRQMIVTVDARRGLDHVVAVDVDGAELSRMVNDLNALVVYGGRDVDGR